MWNKLYCAILKYERYNLIKRQIDFVTQNITFSTREILILSVNSDIVLQLFFLRIKDSLSTINQSFKPMYVVCSTRKQGFHMNMVRNDEVPSPFVNFRPLIYSGQKGQRASSGWVSASYSHVLQLSDIRCCGVWQISHKCVMQKRLWLFILFYSEEQLRLLYEV